MQIEFQLSCLFFLGYASVSTGSSSSSDGTGQSFTAANMNGQGQFVHTQTRPGVPPVTTAGMLPLPPNNNNQYYGPANIGQPGFGLNYGPAYPYGPGFGTNTPAYNPYPQQPFGFNSPFQPLQPFQPIQPVQPFAPFPSLATPQEFNAFLNGIQQQYIAYVSFQSVSFEPKHLFVSDFSVRFRIWFLNEKNTHTYSGGTIAQSTPGATAFATSYLGPTK